MSYRTNDILQRVRDASSAAINSLQTIRIAEIRQTFEFLGVQHFEVVVALFFFVMLQFTKFTAVLIIACVIAHFIFYVWDTYFPEIAESMSKTKHDSADAFYASVPHTYSQQPSTSPSQRDARTSVFLPPFTRPHEDHSDSPAPKDGATAHHSQNTLAATRTPMENTNRKISMQSGAATPIGHRLSSTDNRPQRRVPFPSLFDDYKARRIANNDREPVTYRRIVHSDNRPHRHAVPEPYTTYRYLNPGEEPRPRRLPALSSDEARILKQNKRATTSNGKPSSHRRTEDLFDRYRSASRDNIVSKNRNSHGASSSRPNQGTSGRNDVNALRSAKVMDQKGLRKHLKNDETRFTKQELCRRDFP
ncbi:uncharacterized protein LOC108602197 isoform X2 [Drosophila busckii]|uniref:uncharacterized protein LOC108602197 isoform X2 n=1 Tax=Drosophila busckii TaxID=30019 RepID=UPI00083EC12E|nr:uncharacterized protein LOC108602197 isoform X2 [Drosophila busckii]